MVARFLAPAETQNLAVSFVSSTILLGVLTASSKTLRFRSHQIDHATRIDSERAPFASLLVEFPTKSKNQVVRSLAVSQVVGFMPEQRLHALTELQMKQATGHSVNKCKAVSKFRKHS